MMWHARYVMKNLRISNVFINTFAVTYFRLLNLSVQAASSVSQIENSLIRINLFVFDSAMEMLGLARRPRSDTMEVEAGAAVQNKRAAGEARGAQSSGAGAAVAKAKGKQDRSDRKGESEFQHLLILVSRLALSLEREVSLVKSIVLQVILLRKESIAELIASVKEAMAAFNKAVKDCRTSEERALLGSPHVLVWLEAMQWFKTQSGLKMQELSPAANRYLDKLEVSAKERMEAADVVPADQALALQNARKQEVVSSVRVFRLLRCWNPDLMRLEVNTVSDKEASRAFTAMLMMLSKHAGADIRQGQAPRGDLSRKIAIQLERLGVKKDQAGADGPDDKE